MKDNYVYVDKKKLRRGYTTGSCAAAASKAASIMLFTGKKIENIELMTPKGILLNLKVHDIEITKSQVSCAIKKDSGDDPDVTNGMLIYSKVSKTNTPGINLIGGQGVGTVTREGLQVAVGMPAINNVPRQMITIEVTEVCDAHDYKEGLDVEIIVPGGEEVAKRTFNPRLGIEGGISILGTTGIIEPMSEKALTDTIKVEMKQLYHNGKRYLLVTPGNYGEKFTEANMNVDIKQSVKCSNFVGETIDYANEIGYEGVLFIAHIGKFVKLAGGIMNTHSKNADSRMEILMANAVMARASIDTLKHMRNCVTCDEALDYLDKESLVMDTMDLVTDRIDFYLKNRAGESLEIGAIIFSNKYGMLGKTKDADKILKEIEKGN